MLQVWAYGNLKHDPGALLDGVAQYIERCLQHAMAHKARQHMQVFSPQHVSNILLAYAKLGKPDTFCVTVHGDLCLQQMQL